MLFPITTLLLLAAKFKMSHFRLVPKCFTIQDIRVGWMAAAGFLIPLVYTLFTVPGLNQELAPDSPNL